jgi:predicted nucleic acid-binding protein
VIFVDSTVAIHLVGDDERRTLDAQLLLERAITAGDRLVTDAAVMHEILQRYTDVGCPEAIEPAIELLLGVVDDVLSLEDDDVVRAKEMLYGPERLSPMICLHLAVMERHGVARVMSFNTEYDRYSAVSRLTP